MNTSLHVSATVFGITALGLMLVPNGVDAASPTDWASGTQISVRDCSGSGPDVGCGTDVPAPHLVPLLEVGDVFVAVDEENASVFSTGASQVSFSINPLDAPVIRGSAFSSPIGEENTRVGSSTGAYQGYTYTGATEATVTFHADLDFSAMSETVWPGPDGATISASIGTFETDIVLDSGLAGCALFFCVGGTMLGFDFFQADGPFDGSITSANLEIDVLLSPGQSVFVGTELQVFGERGAFVDAFNTMSTFFTGDPEVLAALSPGTRAADPTVDIRPRSDINPINPLSWRVIPVAILTTSTGDGDAVDFDATQVDVSTVQFGPDGATKVHPNGHVGDVDNDGDPDLLLHFRMRQTGVACGDIEASLAGTTLAGEDFEGTDSVRTVGCPP